MSRLGREALVLAACLALTAGFVDAVGFLELGGFFLSFMSGNTTRLGVGLAANEVTVLSRAGLLIGMFVAGVTLASLLPETLKYRRPLLLGVAGALLGLAAYFSSDASMVSAGLAVLAMGGLNVIFIRDGEVAFGVTYMTGGLVRVGVKLASAFKGGPPWAFVPFLVLWLAMACGAALGATAHRYLSGGALWIAAAACVFLGLGVLRQEPRGGQVDAHGR